MDELTKRTPRRELRYGIKALILSFVMLMIAFPSYARNGNITINVSGVPMQTVLKKNRAADRLQVLLQQGRRERQLQGEP